MTATSTLGSTITLSETPEELAQALENKIEGTIGATPK